MTARILYIEDEAELREDMALELREAGHEVIEAQDGLQGLAAALAGPLDLVLCDVQLPKLGGIDLLRQLQAGDATRDVPFIILTAYGDGVLRRQAEELGVREFLVKPVDFDELLERVAKVLRDRAGG